MNYRDDENLKELLRRFTDERDAKEAAEEIGRAEELLRENPAPQPSNELIARIKADIAEALGRKKHRAQISWAYSAAAVAAAIMVAAAVSLFIFKQERQRARTAAQVSAATELWSEQTQGDFAVLAAEVEELEEQIYGLSWSENGGNGTDVDALEIELLEMSGNGNGDFWKG